MSRPARLIVIGFLLVLAGAVFPFLMVIGLVESTLLLNFVVYIASVAGLFLGVIGVAFYVGSSKQREEDWHDY